MCGIITGDLLFTCPCDYSENNTSLQSVVVVVTAYTSRFTDGDDKSLTVTQNTLYI